VQYLMTWKGRSETHANGCVHAHQVHLARWRYSDLYSEKASTPLL